MRRKFMWFLGGTAAVAPSQLREAPLPDSATGNSIQKGEDLPLIIANMPATGKPRAMAIAAAILRRVGGYRSVREHPIGPG